MIWPSLAIALLAPSTVADTPIAAGPVVASARCELHVWPSAGLKSIYHGLVHGGLVNGAVTGREGYPVVPSEPINTQREVELLTQAAPQRLLRQDDYRLVVHNEALPSRTIRTSLNRIDGSGAQCYAELIVEDVFFQQDIVDGSYLKVLFRYRDFGPDAVPRRVFGTWVKTRLELLPIGPGTDVVAAGNEMRTAFSNNIVLFATALNKPQKAQ